MSNVITVVKIGEKVLLWLYRNDKTQQWLADQLGVTRQSVSQKIRDNYFQSEDMKKLKELGCPV